VFDGRQIALHEIGGKTRCERIQWSNPFPTASDQGDSAQSSVEALVKVLKLPACLAISRMSSEIALGEHTTEDERAA
jgi:hypothetical protein